MLLSERVFLEKWNDTLYFETPAVYFLLLTKYKGKSCLAGNQRTRQALISHQYSHCSCTMSRNTHISKINYELLEMFFVCFAFFFLSPWRETTQHAQTKLAWSALMTVCGNLVAEMKSNKTRPFAAALVLCVEILFPCFHHFKKKSRSSEPSPINSEEEYLPSQ